jgi:formylglycine-generating enzyme required for sulfatase activity/pimeloyl-ACP methyl ester carboxylesterase
MAIRVLSASIAVAFCGVAATGLDFELTLHPGYNLVSIPIDPPDRSVTAVLGSSGAGPVWRWDGEGYQVAEEFIPGVGYWVLYEPLGDAVLGRNSIVVSIEGKAIRGVKRPVNAGWQLIGPIAYPPYAPLPMPAATRPEGRAYTPAWGWDRVAYQPVYEVPPGSAAWVLFSSECELTCCASPEFEGAVMAYSPDVGRAQIHWPEAADDRTTAECMVYRVYAAPSGGRGDLIDPAHLAATATGTTYAVLDGLALGQVYDLTVLAEDTDGNLNYLNRVVLQARVMAAGNTLTSAPKDLRAEGNNVLSVSQDGNRVAVAHAGGLAAGDIIVFDNPAGQGLQRIISMTAARAGTELVTEDVSLADVIGDGELRSSLLISDMTAVKPTGQMREGTLRYRDPAGAFALGMSSGRPDREDGGDVDGSAAGKVAFEAGLEVDYGVGFEPTFDTEARFERNGLTYCRLSAKGKLDVAASADFDMTASANYDDSRKVFGTSHTFFYAIGPCPACLPVWQDVGVDVYVEVSVHTDATLNMEAVYEAAKTIEIGVQYDNGEWSTVTSDGFEQEMRFDVYAEGNIAATVSVYPRIWTRFYGMVSGQLYVVPELRLDSTARLLPPPVELTEFDAGFQVDAFVEATFGIFDRDLGAWQSPHWTMLDIDLFSLPEIEFDNPPEEIVVGSPEEFRVSIADGVNNPVTPENITWWIEADGRALPQLDASVDRRSAQIVGADVGTYRLWVSCRGDGFLGDRGTRYASTNFRVVPREHTVTFDLGEHGFRTGGGELVQKVATGTAAIAPVVKAEAGWTFNGWDTDFGNVTADLTASARYSVTEYSFTDDFESGDLSAWNVTGRKLGVNAIEVIADSGSNVAHLMHGQFTEIQLEKSFTYGPDLVFEFDMKADAHSPFSTSSASYSSGGVAVRFLDGAGNTLGSVSYIKATSSWGLGSSANHVTHEIAESDYVHFRLGAAALLGQTTVLPEDVSSVVLVFRAYASAWSTSLESHVWVDNVAVSEPDAGTFTVSGTVNGALIEGVTMTLSGASPAQVLTAADGAYSFTGLAPGLYTVSASATDGYAFLPAAIPVTLATSDRSGIDFAAHFGSRKDTIVDVAAGAVIPLNDGTGEVSVPGGYLNADESGTVPVSSLALNTPPFDLANGLEPVASTVVIELPCAAIPETAATDKLFEFRVTSLDGREGGTPAYRLGAVRIEFYDPETADLRYGEEQFGVYNGSDGRSPGTLLRVVASRVTGAYQRALQLGGLPVARSIARLTATAVDVRAQYGNAGQWAEARGIPISRYLDADAFIAWWNASSGVFEKLPPDNLAQLDGKRVVVFLHGWQALSGLMQDEVFDTAALNPHVSTWERLSRYAAAYWATPAEREQYVYYTVRYDSDQRIYDSAVAVRKLLADTFPGKKVVVVAHSMGGMVARAMDQQYHPHGDSFAPWPEGGIERIISLNSPYHGTPFAQAMHGKIAGSSPAGGVFADSLIAFLALKTPGTLDLRWDNYDSNPDVQEGNPDLLTLNEHGENDLRPRYVTFGTTIVTPSREGIDEALRSSSGPVVASLGYANDGIVPKVSAHLRSVGNSERTTEAGKELPQGVYHHINVYEGNGIDTDNPVSFDEALYDEILGYLVPEQTELADYLVIDVSGGPSASHYPVISLDSLPSPIPDEYRTTKLVLRRIPAGTFTMGSPPDEIGRSDNETRHQVTLTQDFYIGVFEVTQRQWERVMGTWPSYFVNATGRDARPVEQVSYDDIRGSSSGSGWPANNSVDASSFLGRLRDKSGLVLDLPTEAQWEYACRAGTTTALNSGKNLTDVSECPNMDEVGRYVYNGNGTETVGRYLPNSWGLYDMHGNVWEWCLDWWMESYSADPVTDPEGSTTASGRLLRGGCWGFDAGYCRSSKRDDRGGPALRSALCGARLCAALSGRWP